MVGNAAEEGLLLQVRNPSHLDWGRIVVPAAVLAGCAAGYGLRVLVPSLTIWPPIVLGIVVTVLTGWKLAAWFERRDWAARSAAMEAERAEREAETRRQLARMRAGAARPDRGAQR